LEDKLRLRYKPAIQGVRNADGTAFPEAELESLAKAKAADIWPYLEQVRAERGESGPLTDDQLHIASIRQSRGSIRNSLSKMRSVIGSRGNPRLDSILAGFVEDGEADLEAMAAFEDPNLTEASFEAASAQVVERALARAKRHLPGGA
jgi:hypothetical protein